LVVAACAGTPVSEIYEAVLPAASDSGERHIRVTLKHDGFAAVTSAFSARPSRFVAEGTWQREDGRIAVNLADQQRLLFRQAGDQLVSLEWDHALWGEAGPGVLVRVR
jgi:hypothetical protein